MSSDSDSSDDCSEIVTEKIKEEVENVSLNLSEESRRLYTGTYNTFKKWCIENESNFLSEDLMLAYFHELSKKYAASSLWSTYSMLRTTILNFDQVDISSYKLLIYFLKTQSSGYQPKKSLVFTKEHVSQFLNEAPDDMYLSTKVALIFGIAGGLKRKEFVNLKITDVTELDNLLLIKVTKSINKVVRTFTITDKLCEIAKQYMQFRPQFCETNRFFLQYSKGRCLHQPIGINKFGALPKEVASYLKLTDADKYTGHSFRKTSVSVLVEACAEIALRKHSDGNSKIVSEEYIAEVISNKRKSQQLSSETVLNNKQIKITNIVSNAVSDSLDLMSTSMQLDPLSETNRNVFVTGSSVTSSSKYNSLHQNSLHETNKNITITGNTIMNTSPTCTSSPLQTSSSETNGNVAVTGNSVIEKSHTSNEIEQIFCDPIIDFCPENTKSQDTNKHHQFSNCNITIDGGSHNSMVFSNCNVTITGGSHNSIIFNNCNITNKNIQNENKM